MSSRTPAFRNDGKPTGIQSLPDRARVAARLVYDENKSRAEAARELGVSVGCIANWLEIYQTWQRDQRLVAAMKRSGT